MPILQSFKDTGQSNAGLKYYFSRLIFFRYKMGRSKRDFQNKKNQCDRVAASSSSSRSEKVGRKCKNGSEISSIREVSFKHSQLSVLSRTFELKQRPSPSEIENLAKQTRLSQKQVRTWFANRRSRCKLGKSTAFSKIAKVAVLMDMNTINTIKESILTHLNTDNVVGDDSDSDSERDERISLSEKSSLFESERLNFKQTKFLMEEKENSYGETLPLPHEEGVDWL